MIPIRDDAPRYTTPYVNYFLLAMNVAVFLLMWLGVPAPAQAVVNVFGYRPVQLTAFIFGHNASAGTAGLITMFTAMFLHASWLHLIGNMWVLYIFGDNIEDYLGHFTYLMFYLTAGVAAALLHTVFNATSAIPSVGASGAIAGVMGAYFILFPSARVLTLVPFLFVFFIWLPAWIVLGYWILTQFLSGAATSIAYSNQTSGGIAFWAHVGGFSFGLGMIKLFPAPKRRFRYDG
ncbi:MAG: rhomboid family intramembrane serine protease [Terriglobales bacterium]